VTVVKGAAREDHRVDSESVGPVGAASEVTPVPAALRRLTVEQVAAIYQKQPKALYAFIARRPWLPGVLRMGRSIVIDLPKFEMGLRQVQVRRSPQRRSA
jgi:hypothetical protein